MKFDPNKSCVTDDGRKVRIIATDLSTPASIGAILFGEYGEERFVRFRADGKAWDTDDGMHLVNIEIARYNVMRNSLGQFYLTDPLVAPAPAAPSLLSGFPQPVPTRLGGITVTCVDGKLKAEVTP